MKPLLRNLIVAYLTFLAKGMVKKFQPRFMVITGTAGKTTTKNTIHTVLKEKFGNNVAQTYGSMGTTIGLPLALLQIQPSWVDQNETSPPAWQWPWWLLVVIIRYGLYSLKFIPYPKLWVIEFTADRPGDFSQMLSYIKPYISIVTNVGPGHLEFFKNVEGVAKEKSQIIQALPEGGVAILNQTDALVSQMAVQTKARVYWVKDGGLGFAQAAANVIGQILGMTDEQINRGLAQIKILPHRLDVLKGINDTTVIDSTYNANPISVVSVLEYVKRLKNMKRGEHPNGVKRGDGRVIAVLGDMLELGTQTVKLHQEVGQKAKKLVDILVTIGPNAHLMNGDYHAANIEAASRYLRQVTKKGDTIVVKASHGMRLDKLVEMLRKKDK